MEQLTWTEAADTLRSGDKVIFIQFFDMGSVLIPKGTVAGVRDNDLNDIARTLVLEPDDKGLRAELNYEHNGFIWLFGPEEELIFVGTILCPLLRPLRSKARKHLIDVLCFSHGPTRIDALNQVEIRNT
jgi:hypothetical protein